MPGLCGSLGRWGGAESWARVGSRVHNSWSLGVSHSKDMRVPTMCQVTYGHWEGRTLPTRHCHGGLPMTDRVAVETSATATTQSAGSSLRGSMARDLDSDRPGCQGSGSSILIYYCYYSFHFQHLPSLPSFLFLYLVLLFLPFVLSFFESFFLK